MRKWTEQNCNWLAVGAIVLGAIVRIIWVFFMHPPFDHVYSDMAGYVDRAAKLATGGPLDPYDGHYPPGTHLVLTVPFRVFGPHQTGLWAGAVLWWAMSTLTVFFMWRFARFLLTPAAAALTAAFCALWPLHVTFAGYFSSETPSLAFLSGGLWLAYRAKRTRGEAPGLRGVWAGLVAGVAMAVRLQFILNFLLVGRDLWRRRPRARRVLVGLAAGASVVLIAISGHNSLAEGRLAGPDGHGGLVFFVGHCDVREVSSSAENYYFVFGPPPASQRGTGRVYHFTQHPIWDAGFFYRKGLECIVDDGTEHLGIITRAVADMTALTRPWPQSNESGTGAVITVTNFLYSAALIPIVIGAMLLAQRRRLAGRRSGESIMLAHLVCFVAVAVISGLGEPRYRTVYDIFGLALLAAVVADRFLDKKPQDAEDSDERDSGGVGETQSPEPAV